MPENEILTPRQQAARENGARSRGPITPEGKAKSARNSLKHGLCGQLNIALDNELPAERRGDIEAWLAGHPDDAERVRAALEIEGIEVPVFGGANCLTLRVCAQIYCDRVDIERLGDAVAKLPT